MWYVDGEGAVSYWYWYQKERIKMGRKRTEIEVETRRRELRWEERRQRLRWRWGRLELEGDGLADSHILNKDWVGHAVRAGFLFNIRTHHNWRSWLINIVEKITVIALCILKTLALIFFTSSSQLEGRQHTDLCVPRLAWIGCDGLPISAWNKYMEQQYCRLELFGDRK